MSDLLANPDLFALSFLTVGGVALGLSGLMSRTGPRRWVRNYVYVPLALTIAFVGMTLALTGASLGYWLPLVILPSFWGLGLVLRGPQLGAACSTVLVSLADRRVQGALTLALTPGAVLFFAWQPERNLPATISAHDWIDAHVAVEDLEPISASAAQTDCGRLVTLFRHRPHAATEVPLLERERRILENHALTQKTIRTADPDDRYNCHGWLFAAGRAWIMSDGVEMILHDNGYERVSLPFAGDVVIYRDADAKIVHSGLVVGTRAEGLVLVESKWGIAGRHIHAVDSQCYSQHWEFYHSRRSGNQLRGLDGGAALVATGAANSATPEPELPRVGN